MEQATFTDGPVPNITDAGLMLSDCAKALVLLQSVKRPPRKLVAMVKAETLKWAETYKDSYWNPILGSVGHEYITVVPRPTNYYIGR